MYMKKVGINFNLANKSVLPQLEKVVEAFESMGYECSLNTPDGLKLDPQMGLAVAVGGDGTILRIARLASEYDLPVLGINVGRVGFLNEISVEDVERAVSDFEDGKCFYDRLIMMECTINGKEKLTGVNDIIMYKNSFYSTVHIDMEFDGISAGEVYGDGIIISTPTGSTAYNLSAGGPILHQNIDAFSVTPICPHSLGVRPMVFSADTAMKFTVRSEGKLSVDGVDVRELCKNDVVEARRSDKFARIIRFQRRNIYSLIRGKLG